MKAIQPDLYCASLLIVSVYGPVLVDPPLVTFLEFANVCIISLMAIHSAIFYTLYL